MEDGSLHSSSGKPWGGRLEALRDYPDPAMSRFDVVSWTGLLLRKAAELSLMACLLAVPMMYQWDLPRAFQQWIKDWLEEGAFFHYQVASWIGGMMPVLETKFGAWVVLGVMMIVFYLAARVGESLSGRKFFPVSVVSGESSRSAPHRFVPLVCIGVFLGLGALSIVLWAPPVPPEAQPFLGGDDGGWLSGLGGGAFMLSTVTWLQVAFGLVFFLVAEDLVRRRPYVIKLLGVLVIAGIVNAVWVVLLKMEFPGIQSIWVRFGEMDHRNALGGFIGHNTGLSSFLMAPILISLMWIFSISPRRNRLWRGLFALGILAMLLAVVLAQSRAVIPILAVTVALLLFRLARRSCLVPGSRLYIWLPTAIVFIVLTQVVDSPWNPLFRRDITLEQRVSQLTPGHLTTETRLRILWVSATQLIPQRLPAGHGMGTFSYVYPSAQGEFYRLHPDSRLAPTPHRTFRAHNEYLQVLVELGVLGLATALLALFFLARGAISILQRTLMPHHIATQLAVLCSALALLIHCALDFPLRVPPVAVTLVVLLAIISAGDRLWLFPLKPPRQLEEEGAEDPPTEEIGLGLPDPSRSGRRNPVLIATGMTGVAGVIALGGATLLATLWAPFQSVHTFVNRGQSLLEAAYESRARGDLYLRMALGDLQYARRTFWIYGPVNRMHAQAQYLRALRTVEEANQADSLEVAAHLRGLALTYARHGISDINQALSEENFHSLYRTRASLNSLLARNDPDRDARRRHQREELEDLVRAANMNPGDAEIIFLLIQILDSDPVRNRSFLTGYLHTLHHFHTGFFRDTVFQRAADAMAVGEWELAISRLDVMTEAIPHDPYLLLTEALARVRNGEVEGVGERVSRALELLEGQNVRTVTGGLSPQARRQMREMATLAVIEREVKAGNDLTAVRELEKTENFATVPRSLIAAHQLFLKKRMEPDSPEIATREQDLRRLGNRTDPFAWQVAGTMALYVYDKPAEAEKWMRLRQGVASPPMDLISHVVLARALEQQGRLGEALEIFGPWNEIYQRFPDIDIMQATPHATQLAQRYARELRERVRAANEEESP